LPTSANGNPLAIAPCRTCQAKGTVWTWQGGWAVCPDCGGSGRKEPPFDKLAFTYVLPTIQVPANFTGDCDSIDGPISLQLDDDVLFQQTSWVLAQLRLPFAFDFTIFVSDQSNGMQLMNAPANWKNFAGSAGKPAPLLVPKLWHLSAQIRLQVDVTLNANADSDTPIQLALKGYKIYPPGTLAKLVAAGAAGQGAQAQ
jgi:hypothetical protein